MFHRALVTIGHRFQTQALVWLLLLDVRLMHQSLVRFQSHLSFYRLPPLLAYALKYSVQSGSFALDSSLPLAHDVP